MITCFIWMYLNLFTSKDEVNPFSPLFAFRNNEDLASRVKEKNKKLIRRPRCEKRMKQIPFKPLTQRMIEEPFWLGLITVTIVLNILGIGWFAKKHLSDKIEKLLFPDDTMNNNSNLIKQQSHSHDLNSQLSCGSDPPEGGAGADPRRCSSDTSPIINGVLSRSLLGRLALRKTSLLSFSSNNSSPISGEKRNFSSQEEITNNPRNMLSPNRRGPPSQASVDENSHILRKLLSRNGRYQRTQSEIGLTSLIIKATRSAENITSGEDPNVDRLLAHSPMSESFRKDSSLSLQIPATIYGNKKVTFSKVVDEMASSISGSASCSDVALSFDGLDEPTGTACKKNLSLPVGNTNGSRPRKLVRSSRISQTKVPNCKSASLPGTMSPIDSEAQNSIETMDSSKTSKKLAKQKGLFKISSADSLISMIRSLTNNRNAISTPSSPQLSHDSSGEWSKGDCSEMHVIDKKSPVSSRHGSLKRQKECGSQIQVEVLSPAGTPEFHPDIGMSASSNSNSIGNSPGPTITLEVPNFSYGQLLSPIKELPSPMPTPHQTPLPSPLPHHRSRKESNDYSKSPPTFSIDCNVSPTPPPILVTTYYEDEQKQITDSNIVTLSCNIIPPSIIITPSPLDTTKDGELSILPKLHNPKQNRSLIKQSEAVDEIPFDSAPRSRSQSIEIRPPKLHDTRKNWTNITIGSPPSKKSEGPPVKAGNLLNLPVEYGMATTSESNLSSSGYSSMTSPSGSLNPLENDDSGSKILLLQKKRSSPIWKTYSVDSESSETMDDKPRVNRTDSEVTEDVFVSTIQEDFSNINLPTVSTFAVSVSPPSIPEIAIEPCTPPWAPTLERFLDHSLSLQEVKPNSTPGLNRNCCSAGSLMELSRSTDILCKTGFSKSSNPIKVPGDGYKRLKKKKKLSLSPDSNFKFSDRILSDGRIDRQGSNESLHSNNSNKTWDGQLTYAQSSSEEMVTEPEHQNPLSGNDSSSSSQSLSLTKVKKSKNKRKRKVKQKN